MKTAAAVAVALSVVVLAALAAALYWPQPETPEPAAAPLAAEPTAPETRAAHEDVGEPPWRVIEQEVPLDRDTLPGTEWRAGPYTLAFLPNGGAMINRRVRGQWSLVGDAVVVNAAGETLRGTIDGVTMVFEGRQAERIEFTEPDGPQDLRPRAD